MARTRKHLALTARPAAAESQDLAAQLRVLMDLHRAGVLTTAELEASRSRLLWAPRPARPVRREEPVAPSREQQAS